jgi:hypothetical protein
VKPFPLHPVNFRAAPAKGDVVDGGFEAGRLLKMRDCRRPVTGSITGIAAPHPSGGQVQ